jgi:hypothetical protein
MTRVTILPSGTNQPEAVFNGSTNSLICHVSFSVSGTFSSTDDFIVGRLPHGAIPLDCVFYPGAAMPVALQVFKFGTSASLELFFASASYSGNAIFRTTRDNLATRQRISLSDDAMPRYENLIYSPTLVGSVGHVGDFVVTYKMPGQTY